MAELSIRRAWQVSRPAERDTEQAHQRRLLDQELERWGAGTTRELRPIGVGPRPPVPRSGTPAAEPIQANRLLSRQREAFRRPAAPEPEEQLARAFVPRETLPLQREAFRGRRPIEVGAERAAQIRQAVRPQPAPERMRRQAIARALDAEGLTPQEYVAALGLRRPAALPADVSERARRVTERVGVRTPAPVQEFARAFQPRGLEAQAYGFAGISPTAEGQRRAAEFGGAVRERPETLPALEFASQFPDGITLFRDQDEQEPSGEHVTPEQITSIVAERPEMKEFFTRHARGDVGARGTVLGPIDVPFHFAGLGAERAAGALGAPREIQTAANIGTQLALAVAAGRVPTANLPAAIRGPVEALAVTLGSQPTGAAVPRRIAGEFAQGAPLEAAAVRRGLEVEPVAARAAAELPPSAVAPRQIRYHGTTAAGEAGIAAEGRIRPTQAARGTLPGVYLHGTTEGAETSARTSARLAGDQPAVIQASAGSDLNIAPRSVVDEIKAELRLGDSPAEMQRLADELQARGYQGADISVELRGVARPREVIFDPEDVVPQPRMGAEAAGVPGAVRMPERPAPPPPAVPRGRPQAIAGAAEEELARIDPELAAGREPMVGVGAATAELPTVRSVEAQSARVPIEDKRASAIEVLENTSPTARPLSVNEVAQQWGNRYKSNWFTKFDDLIAKFRGKDRPLEKSVRDAMVTRDLYAHQEGYVQLQRVNAWMGRNKDALGMRYEARVPGAEGRWYARGVEVKPGAKIPKRARQRLKDIRERPEDYVLTADQQRALDEAGDLFEQMKLSNFQHGVDFEAVDPKTYWPGVVTNAPEGSGIPVFRGAGAELTATPGWAKPRQIPTLRQGLAAGAEYVDDLEAMTIRLSGGAQANANRWAVEQVQRLGAKPSEKIKTALGQNLKDARKAYTDARAEAARTARLAAKRPDDVVQRFELRRAADTARQTAIEAEVALDQAKATLRADANRVSLLRPRVFGRVVAPDVANELSRYVATDQGGVVDDILQLWRGSMVTGDHSSLFNQNAILFFRNPVAWSKAATLSTLAFKEAPYAWAARHADDIESAIRLGFATPPSEFLLRQGRGISQFFNKLPVVRQSQRGFEWNIFIGQVERYKAAKSIVTDPQALMDMASVTRKQAGILWTPGMTKRQAAALSKTFFAPQYTTAFISALTDPLLKSGAARREALKSLGMMFGGAASLTIGANYAINRELPNMTDPEKAGFWGIRLGGGFVYPLGPFQPLMRTIALSAPEAVGGGGDVKAWGRFIEGKVSVPARILLRAAEAMGVPLEDVRGPSYSDPTKTFGERGLGESFIDIAPGPIGLTEAIEGVRRDAPVTLLEPAGIRTTIETPKQKFERLYRERHGAAPDPNISPRQLDPELAQEAGYERVTEFAQERAEVTAGEERRLADLSNIVLRGNPDAMEQFEEELGDFFRFRSGVTETLVRELDLPDREASLVNDYYEIDPRDRRDPETGDPDWDYFESRREGVLSRLRREGASGGEAAAALERGTGIQFAEPELQRTYDALQTLKDGLDAYYEVDPEKAKKREAFRRRNPELDAKLFLLGRVSRVVTAQAQREVRTLSRRLLGTEVEAGRGESRGGLGGPIEIGPIQPIRIGAR